MPGCETRVNTNLFIRYTMQADYLNRNAERFLDKMSQPHKAWAQFVIDALRKRYPMADHWTTGGEGFKYTDIRIGRKAKGKAKGLPVFYIRQPKGKGPVSLLVNIKARANEDEYELPYDSAHRQEHVQQWINGYVLSDVGHARVEGSGLNPADYPDSGEGSDEGDADDDATAPVSPDARQAVQALNRILYGPPGTGKTYRTMSEALAIIEGVDSPAGDYDAQKKRFDALCRQGRIAFVTFHQSFSYEDFIEGIRAETSNGQISYRVKDGIFKKMAIAAMYPPYAGIGQGDESTAGQDDYERMKRQVLEAEALTPNGKPYVLIVDEINRGNMSRIFGELITLIEASKRAGRRESAEVRLPYSNERFSVPANLYLIGTMNTADRSLAVVDTALRRRFDFVEMMPAPDKLHTKSIGVGADKIDLVQMLNAINARIEQLYDREHMIGHSFFMGLTDDSTIADLALIFKNNILPLLEEYFFEDWDKIRKILGKAQIHVAHTPAKLGLDHQGKVYRRDLAKLERAATYQAIYRDVDVDGGTEAGAGAEQAAAAPAND